MKSRKVLFTLGYILVTAAWLLLTVPFTPAAPPAIAGLQPANQGRSGFTAVDYSPDGATLASGGADSQVILWDEASGRRIKNFAGHLGAPVTGLDYSPIGTTLASVGRDSIARLWDIAGGQELRIFQGHEQPVRAVAFGPDGALMATVGEDTRVTLWDMRTGQLKRILTGHRDFINAVAISPDGATVASASNDDRIILWDAASGAIRYTLLGHSDDVTGIAFSKNGQTLISVSRDTTVRVWDVKKGEQRRIIKEHKKPQRAAAFSSDDSTIASGGEDNEVILSDVNSGQTKQTLRGHTGPVNSLSFSPDGKRIASASGDNSIIIWDVSKGTQIRKIQGSAQPARAAAGVQPQAAADGSAARQTDATMAALDSGPGGPILVITSATAANPFGGYYAEILRNEGFNAFAVTDITSVSAATLAGYDVAILAEMSLSATQVTMLSDWVATGGNLIAMRPDKQLAGLLGLNDAGSTVNRGYLLVNTTTTAGSGITGQTMQFHGSVDHYTLNGATSIATLYSSAAVATSNPAITLRSVGSNGGQAAAFTYDLARSIVYARQGNPAWSGQERDGFSPIRSDDLYFGDAIGDSQPDWVDLNRVGIPQADEQQRLLANLIIEVSRDRKPLPRFWYFPNRHKAVVIMTGDDHGNNGTAGRFDQYIASSPPGCSVDDWECIRGASYIYTSTPLSDAQAASYNAQGFEIGLHISTNCLDYTPASLEANYAQQIPEWQAKYASLPAPTTNRTHCIAWSDWATQARVSLSYGIRLDTNYYYWPPNWVQDRPGYFTGSAMPMRFADTDGSIIDVYQAATQNTDESGQSYPLHIDALLDKALGAEGYYGAITVNAHTDWANSSVSDAVINSAQARSAPVVTARQMLTWLDGRNSSTFGDLAWDGATLNFTITAGSGARGLYALLPTAGPGGTLAGISHNGSPATYSVEGIKGVEYAIFAANDGAYTATYASDTTPPTAGSPAPAANATGVSQGTSVSATFSEAMDANTINSATFELRDPANAAVPATVTYDAASRTATLKPSSSLAPETTYTARIAGGGVDPRAKDLAGNAMATDFSWSFTTAAAPTCPCSIWSSSATPANASVNDPNGVELGVKFQADIDGYITGIRFYRGPGNNGVHTGSLWRSDGTQLATVTFTSETGSGWQQATFATPVAISANTTYVASYYAPNGSYAADNDYFAAAGVANYPLRALRDGEDGGNGVYKYGASGFPTSTYRATNYWVDVVFTTSTGSGGTPTPTFTSTPTAQATNTPTPTFTSTPTAQATNTPTPTPTGTPASGPCAAPANPIVAENCRTGNPPSEWDVSGAGDPSIQGFATDISVNRGATVSFKINTSASDYRIDIYRLGYYGGQGARKVATVQPTAALPQGQPACLTDATGLIDCGNWAVSAAWAVPADAVSGIYIARPVRTDTNGASHIVFIVRDDAGTSDIFFQTADTTWQAYNRYGGNSLYTGAGPGSGGDSDGRAYKVSYNRPFNTRSIDNGQDWLFNAEYPMLRWLERNGYDVAYTTGVDSDRRGDLIRNHRLFLSIGHDEYWSATQRSNVEAARDAGVHMAFFSGNEVFWKTRWETSIDGSGQSYRTLVCYKETHENAKIDPDPAWTGTWRDPRFSPPADGGRPENALTGQLFMVNDGATTAIQVPAEEGKLRLWRHTSIANLAPGSAATLAAATLGYEWDEDVDNGVRPAGLFRLSRTVVNNAPILLDYGSTFGSGTATHSLTMYRHSSGALVFGAGTVQWSWGLDSNHDRGSGPEDARMQQATVNLFADMGVQPATLQSGLTAAAASTDATPPGATIASPENGATLQVGSPVTISGSATDSGGQVAGVEVSTDGSAWHPANGRASWSYTWTPEAAGSVTIRARAVDDSGNIQATPASVTVTVGARVCPCSLWSDATTPVQITDPDPNAVELGVKFRSDEDGYITGIRFYKGPENTGVHTGSLWSSSGVLLAQATFANETASGWQQADFATPVAITANTVYVASYHAPNGRYSQDSHYFTTSFDNPPLHALSDGENGPNGVYVYSATPVFPTEGYNASNNWVDIVFTTTTAPASTSTSAPTPTSTTAPASTSTSTPIAQPDGIFADGFESGDFAAWSARFDDENDLSVAPAAAMVGTNGMAALIDNNTAMYLRDDSPASEPRYRARFYFNPNGITMSNGNTHRIMAARNADAEVIRIDFRRSGNRYQISASLRTDGGSYVATSWYTITDAPHAIEIDWQAATAAGANNGYLSLWIDGALQQTRNGIDNDTLRVEELRLGPLSGIVSGTRGTTYFDDFVSRRSAYIGP